MVSKQQLGHHLLAVKLMLFIVFSKAELNCSTWLCFVLLREGYKISDYMVNGLTKACDMKLCEISKAKTQVTIAIVNSYFNYSFKEEQFIWHTLVVFSGLLTISRNILFVKIRVYYKLISAKVFQYDKYLALWKPQQQPDWYLYWYNTPVIIFMFNI